MALKHMRPEKRVPTFQLMVTGVIFVVLFLLAVWVFSTPSAVQDKVQKEGAYKKETVFENNEDLPGSSFEAGKVEEDDSGWSSKKTKSDPVQEFEDETDAEGEVAVVTKRAPKPKPDEDPDEKAEDEPVEKPAVTSIDKKVETDDDGEDTVGPKDVEGGGSSKKDTDTAEIPLVDQEIQTVTVKEDESTPVNAKDVELTVENNEISSGWESQSKESKEAKSEIVEEGSSTTNGAGKDETASGESSDDIAAVVGSQTGGNTGETDLVPDWKPCEFENAMDYIPCLDNKKALKQLKSTKHYEHRERHCPSADEMPKCLVPLPEGYQVPVPWPESRSKVWYSNVPHTKLENYKKDQNWVKKQGDYLYFSGAGTQFKKGASHYIEFLQQSKTDVAWGKHTRVILDVGCGVASFGGFLFEKDVLTMSLAPKDEHEAQVQFALERGIPAFSAVMGTQRLPFPSNVFDAVHCARCRVPWTLDDGRLLLELNRLLRPGGYFLWSATPVYKKEEEDIKEWKDMLRLTAKMCWSLQSRTTDQDTGIGVAIFKKTSSNMCYDQRSTNFPPVCEKDDKPDAAWYVPMKSCLHRLPEGDDVRGKEWPAAWPNRLTATPSWLSGIRKGLYGQPANEEFVSNTEHWERVVKNSYLKRILIEWSHVRNVMDMNAGYGGFAAALISRPVWVMNIVPTHEPDTLPIIYERGLFGMYHDWCESFSTYPRTYDLVHADHLFSRLKNRCGLLNTIIELDRIVRPEGWVIFRDKKSLLTKEVLPVLSSLYWQQTYSYEQDEEQLLVVQKSRWRPDASA